MSLTEYKKTIKNPVRPRTVTFLTRDQEVLLVLKKRGFGKGNRLGVGGKIEEDKDERVKGEDLLTVAKKAAAREIFEEIDVIVAPEDLVLMATLRFYFPHIADESWNQEVFAFVANKWKGEPRAKKDEKGLIEVEPEWVNKSEIPFDRMWDDAHYWLPKILTGKRLEGEFIFDENLRVTERLITYN